MKKITSYIKLMRVQHYIKNVLIFLPIVFSKNIFQVELLINTIIGAIAFSLMTSVVYIINDIKDIEADKKHKKKKFRPIASGEVTIYEAYVTVMILLVISTLLNFLIRANIFAGIIFYGYLIINIWYSIKLKHIPIVDIVVLASGFLLRLLYGAEITGIQISNWLYLTILAFSFYMALGKRRKELEKIGNESRKVLQYYNESFLTNNMYMCVALGIVFYALWCIDINNTNLIWTVPFVIVICMKYSLNIEKDTLGDPVDVILEDKTLLLLGMIYAITMFIVIYF